MLCTILWKGNPVTLLVNDHGSDKQVTATPVVVNYWFGVVPGLYFTQGNQFGWWYSSNITSVLTAWRVAQLLPQVKCLRDAYGNDQTLCSLVIQLRGDDHEKRRQNLATDFGITIEEMTQLLEETRRLGPSPNELESILEHIHEELDEDSDTLLSHLHSIERAEAAGVVSFTPRALELVEAARNRRRARDEQLEADASEVEAEVEPGLSVGQLLKDIGLPNLLNPFPDSEGLGPAHVAIGDFDHFVKDHCIGRYGFYESVPIRVSEKNPDDPSAHHSSSTVDGAVTLFMSDFGNINRPSIVIGDLRLVIHSVRYERGGTFWLKISRRALPTSLELDDQSDAQELSIADFRQSLGELLDLSGPLPINTRPELEGASVVPTKRRRRFFRRRN